MRKHLLTSLLIIFLTGLTMNGQAGLRPRGDVNRDWTVNVSDINALIDSIFHDAKYHALYLLTRLISNSGQVMESNHSPPSY